MGSFSVIPRFNSEVRNITTVCLCRSLDAVSNFTTVGEGMSEAVQKLYSTVRSLLSATTSTTKNESSEKYLDYLRSLSLAAETTLQEMERLKADLISLITTLKEKEATAKEIIDLPGANMYVSIYSRDFFVLKTDLVFLYHLAKIKVKVKRKNQAIKESLIWRPIRLR